MGGKIPRVCVSWTVELSPNVCLRPTPACQVVVYSTAGDVPKETFYINPRFRVVATLIWASSMRIRVFGNISLLCALKVIVGSAIVLAVMLNGVKLVSCPPNVFCLVNYEFYSMRLNLWSGFAVLLSLGLLLSAFKDLFVGLEPFELIERNIECIADVD